MSEQKLLPIHPGEVLVEEFLTPMGLSHNQLALAINLPVEKIDSLVRGKQTVTAAIALRLAQYFGMSPRFWLGLQMDYDLDMAEEELGESIRREIVALSSG